MKSIRPSAKFVVFLFLFVSPYLFSYGETKRRDSNRVDILYILSSTNKAERIKISKTEERII